MNTFHTHETQTPKTPKVVIAVGVAAVLTVSAAFIGSIVYGATLLGSEVRVASLDSLMALAREDSAEDDQIIAYIKADPVRHLKQLTAIADSGDKYAQTMLCYILSDGKAGVKVNTKKALANCHAAAEQNHAPAMMNLGTYYKIGVGVEKDYQTSQAFYRRAVEQYTVSADAGNESAQYQLGNLYRYGNGVPHNADQAFKYIDMAAQNGHAEALHQMGKAAADGSMGKINYELAADYLQRSLDAGHVEVAMELARMYRTGSGVKRNIKKADSLRQMAVDHDLLSGLYDLGRAYLYGDGVELNLEKAHALYLRCAEKGHAASMSIVGQNFLDGKGVTAERETGMMWLQAGADLGNQKAFERLADELKPKKDQYRDAEKKALAYMNGDGVAKDPEQEVYWMIQAASKGSTIATLRLSRMYELGENVPKSDVAALYWMYQMKRVNPNYPANTDGLAARLTESQYERALDLIESCPITRFKSCFVNEI